VYRQLTHDHDQEARGRNRSSTGASVCPPDSSKGTGHWDAFCGSAVSQTELVCFRWNEGTTPERVDEVAAALRELPGLIPEIRSFKCGPDVGVNAGNWDFAVVAEFDSIDDQTIYPDHPEHQRVITDLVAPIRAAVQ
jgi:hypothetical protein